ncbi:MAG: hypothetical protein RMM58_02455 [Chloroflexota bacterium]|nr:hypothetical protein [Chloroflexota bacterium]
MPTAKSNATPSSESAVLFCRAVLLALLGASAVAGAVWAASGSKLIYTDEIAFFRDFRRIAAGQWEAIRIPHPPLYTALGGLSVRLVGEGTLALRLPGLIASLAALLLVPAVCLAITERADRARRAALLALAGLALQPLILQGSLLLDIDNTVMTAALLGWIAAVGLSAARPAWQQTLLVGATFALLLWTKLLPAPALFVVTLLAVFGLARQRLAPLAAGLLAGAVAFGISFAIFLAASGSDLAVYLSTVARSRQALRPEQYLSRAVMGGGIQMFWIGLPFLALMLTATLATLRAFFRRREHPVAAWCSLSVLAGFALFTLGNELPMGFPRYQVPLVWVGTIVTASWLAGLPWRPDWQFAAAAVPALGLYFWLAVRDPLAPQYALTVMTDSVAERLVRGLEIALVAIVIPFGLTLAAALARFRRVGRALLAATLFFSVAYWSALSVAQFAAEYATIYEYGRRGGWEAGALIRAGTPAGSEIVAPLELVYASGREGQFIYDYLCPDCLPALLDRLDRAPPAAFAFSQKEERRYSALLHHPALLARLAACYEPARPTGSYIVFLRRAAPC